VYLRQWTSLSSVQLSYEHHHSSWRDGDDPPLEERLRDSSYADAARAIVGDEADA